MSDSLQTGYTALAIELARLEDNFTKAQENLGKEGAALQQEVAGLQNRAQQGLLSPKQIQDEQQRIGRKEQAIRQKQEIAMGSIQQEQLLLQEKFAAQVRSVLEDLKAENGYDYVLNQSAGSGVLVADPKHDITPLVLERLNALGENAMKDVEETVEEK
jgi:Skp family chaperone for outer membrane proteins